ncbi:MAG: hypothetical protein IAE90_06935 [Ignavibacteria bacterium]|mgnify:CR=1 FL=1|nr:hypothetical protein [Ignavibacteria bacterium]
MKGYFENALQNTKTPAAAFFRNTAAHHIGDAVADSGREAFNGRSGETGNRILPFRDAEVHLKPRKAKRGNKDILKGTPGKKSTGAKLKSSKRTNKGTSKKKENNNKINRKKKPKC